MPASNLQLAKDCCNQKKRKKEKWVQSTWQGHWHYFPGGNIMAFPYISV